ncbi:MAG: hypothetical protein NUV46_02350 [Nanoarchaeota archaeon]|nr:hypothetical protein [Nanoarchaeota archaeon]
MKLTKKLVWNFLHEIKPLVEENSELKCDLEKTKLKLTHNVILPMFLGEGSIKNALIYHYHLDGGYIFCFDQLRVVNRKFEEKELKGLLAHELMHNAQFYSFPKLYENIKCDPNFGGVSGKNSPLEILMEGDANLIGNEFGEGKAPKIPKIILKFIGEDYYQKFSDKNYTDIYEKGEKILREKFNNGKDRKSINELYTAPIEELEKIFGDE